MAALTIETDVTTEVHATYEQQLAKAAQRLQLGRFTTLVVCEGDPYGAALADTIGGLGVENRGDLPGVLEASSGRELGHTTAVSVLPMQIHGQDPLPFREAEPGISVHAAIHDSDSRALARIDMPIARGDGAMGVVAMALVVSRDV